MKAGRKHWVYIPVKTLSRILLSPFFCLEARGHEYLPKDRALVFLPKHQRWEDIPLLALAVHRPLYYIAKHELFENPFGSWFLKSLGGIPLNRQRPLESRSAIKAMVELLKKGDDIVVFPEGTYFKNRMGPGQVGIVRLILSRFSLPFVPVGIKYSQKGWRTSVRINFGKAFYPDSQVDADKFLGNVMKEIALLSGLD